MKRICFILLLILFASYVNAQKIHWVVDVQSQQCREYFKRNFADIINSALKESGVLSDFQNDAQNVQCDAEDIIFYCNIGNSGFEEMHNLLAAKNPKLILSVSMLCDDGVNNSLSDNTGSMYIAPEQLECIRDVFLNTCGVLIASDCRLSTVCLRFMEMLEDQEIEFERLFKGTNGNIKAQLKQCGFQNVADDNIQTEINIIESDISELEQYFDLIVGSRKDVDNQDEIFADDCVVFVLGQDGRTLIDRMSISSYLLRITMSSVLLRTVPVAKVIENGRIKQLYVREYYKR